MSNTMILDGPHDEAALILMGARRISERRDPAGELTGYKVEPGLDMSAYPAALAEVRMAALLAHLKNRRWQAETSGVVATVAGEPVRISTARGDDRAALHQVYSAISAGLRNDGAVFNFADGAPRGVSNAEMTTAVLTALAHVQACFDLEGELRAAIEAGTLTTKQEIDAAAWPAN